LAVGRKQLAGSSWQLAGSSWQEAGGSKKLAAIAAIQI